MLHHCAGDRNRVRPLPPGSPHWRSRHRPRSVGLFQPERGEPDSAVLECLAIDLAGSIRSRRVIDVPARLISMHGVPAYLRSDSGPELV